MTSMRTLAGLALASTLLLSGCGAVPAFNPGVAASVGDDSVSVSTVDDTTESFCGAAKDQLQGKSVPNGYLRGQVAGALALRSAATQMMEEYDVEVGPSYQAAVDQATSQLGALTADQRDALIEVQGTSLYVGAAETAVGKSVLDGSPSDKEATAAGAKVFTTWIADHDVRIDPRFGISVDTGAVVAEDTAVTYALSDLAVAGNAEQPDTAAAAELPATQRCG